MNVIKNLYKNYIKESFILNFALFENNLFPIWLQILRNNLFYRAMRFYSGCFFLYMYKEYNITRNSNYINWYEFYFELYDKEYHIIYIFLYMLGFIGFSFVLFDILVTTSILLIKGPIIIIKEFYNNNFNNNKPIYINIIHASYGEIGIKLALTCIKGTCKLVALTAIGGGAFQSADSMFNNNGYVPPFKWINDTLFRYTVLSTTETKDLPSSIVDKPSENKKLINGGSFLHEIIRNNQQRTLEYEKKWNREKFLNS
jgi:hypothetical protein